MWFEFDLTIPNELNKLGTLGDDILDRWTAHAPELAEKLQERVRERTPVWTGALRESVMAFGGIDRSRPIRKLVEVFFDPMQQLDSRWKRQYDVYQEGPFIGLSTYTNPPRRMLQAADPVDLVVIIPWAEEHAHDVVDVLGT